ncbi:MAG: ERCC4 domain-containing protein [Candidatus Methanomethylicaceae archaeon]
MIVIDHNEPYEIRGIADKVESLPIDAHVTGVFKNFYVERKEVKDLYASIRDGRLFQQLEFLRVSDGVKLVVIVGDFGVLFHRFKITMPAFFALQYVIAVNNIGLIHLKTNRQYMLFLKYLDKKAGDAPKQYTPPSRHRRGVDERLRVLCGFDGIGLARAKTLLQYFKTLGGVFAADEADLVKAVGEKHGKNIYRITREPWRPRVG